MTNLKLISLNLTRRQLEEIDKIVEEGLFPNRSEAIRFAVELLIRFYRDKKLDVKELIKPKTVEVSSITRVHKTTCVVTWFDKLSKKILLEIDYKEFTSRISNANGFAVVYCPNCNKVYTILFTHVRNNQFTTCPRCGTHLEVVNLPFPVNVMMNLFNFLRQIREEIGDIISNFYRTDINYVYDRLKEVLDKIVDVLKRYDTYIARTKISLEYAKMQLQDNTYKTDNNVQ